MRPFEILEPTSVAEASQALRQYGDTAKVVSGGTAVTLLLKEGLLAPHVLISTHRLPGLDFLRPSPNALVVGARTTLRALERSAEVRARFPALARALAVIGNVRVRHAATVGGHLAHADARLDLPPVLIALGARVRCARDGASREVPVADLFVGSYETCLAPDELITELTIPMPRSRTPRPSACASTWLATSAAAAGTTPFWPPCWRRATAWPAASAKPFRPGGGDRSRPGRREKRGPCC